VSVHRYVTAAGTVRYRARVKAHGRHAASRVFDRKADAVAWEQDQLRDLRTGEWIDPRRGRVALREVAEGWLDSRNAVKRRSRESDEANWRLHVEPTFGDLPVTSITKAAVSRWVGALIANGASPSSTNRYLATLRSILAFAVADGRIQANPAVGVKPPSGAHTRREGAFLTLDELRELRQASAGPYADVVLFLGLTGLRWGEVAGLQVGDMITLPGYGLRLQRAVLSSRADGTMYVDTLKNKRSRTVPLVPELVPLVTRWAAGREDDAWLFAAPHGGPLNEGNWKRAVQWTAATRSIGRPRLRVHDLRHTAASLWLAAGADPKVVQRVLGHSSAAMTMDLYGHLVDQNLWDAAAKVTPPRQADDTGTVVPLRRELH
jgi:integrase